MKAKLIANNIKTFSKKNATTILTMVGIGGIILSTYLWVKQTPVAMEKVAKAKEAKGADLTKVEKIKAGAPAYIGPSLVTIGTITSFIAANKIGLHQMAELAGLYKISEKKLKERVDAEKRTVGEQATKDIDKNVAHEDLRKNPCPVVADADGLYWIRDTEFGVKFRANIQYAQEIANDLNDALYQGDRVSAAMYFDQIGVPANEIPALADSYIWDRPITGLIKIGKNPEWDTDANGNPVMLLTFENKPIFWKESETVSVNRYMNSY